MRNLWNDTFLKEYRPHMLVSGERPLREGFDPCGRPYELSWATQSGLHELYLSWDGEHGDLQVERPEPNGDLVFYGRTLAAINRSGAAQAELVLGATLGEREVFAIRGRRPISAAALHLEAICESLKLQRPACEAVHGFLGQLESKTEGKAFMPAHFQERYGRFMADGSRLAISNLCTTA